LSARSGAQIRTASISPTIGRQFDGRGNLETLEKETDAKIQSLKEQAAKARGDMKAHFEERAAEIKADYEARAEELSQAWASGMVM